MEHLCVDALASTRTDAELCAEDPSRFSLALSMLSPPPPELTRGYAAFVNALRRRLSEELLDCMYLYPVHALHCTVATLHGYLKPPPADSTQLIEAWQPRLRRATSSIRPFHVTLGPARTEASAGIFHIADPTHSVQRVREQLSALVESEDLARALEQAGSSRKFFRTPEIVHITFMRVRRVPPSEQAARLLNDTIREEFNATIGGVQIAIRAFGLRQAVSLHAIRGHVCDSIPLYGDSGFERTTTNVIAPTLS